MLKSKYIFLIFEKSSILKIENWLITMMKKIAISILYLTN